MSQMKGEREEGREEGIEQGIEQGEDRVNMLIKKLSESGRTDDIIRSASDREFQDSLFHELGL